MKKRRKNQPSRLEVDVVQTKQLVLVDEYGTERASMTCAGGDGGKGGDVTLHLFDDRGRPRLTVQVDCYGSPSIALYHGDNPAPGVSMAVQPDGGTGLGLYDSEGHPVLSLSVPSTDDPVDTCPRLDVIDRDGRRVFSAFRGVDKFE